MMSPEEMNRNAEEILSSISGKELTAMDRAAIPHQEMPVQDPKERITNFKEVSLGFDEKLMLAEAAIWSKETGEA